MKTRVVKGQEKRTDNTPQKMFTIWRDKEGKPTRIRVNQMGKVGKKEL